MLICSPKTRKRLNTILFPLQIPFAATSPLKLDQHSALMRAIRLYTQLEERHSQVTSVHDSPHMNSAEQSVFARSMMFPLIESQMLNCAGHALTGLLDEFDELAPHEKVSNSIEKTVNERNVNTETFPMELFNLQHFP